MVGGSVDLVEGADLVDGPLQHVTRGARVLGAELQHGSCHGVHANDVGAILQYLLLIVRFRDEPLYQFANLQVVPRVADGPFEVSHLKEDQIAVVVEHTLVLQPQEVVMVDQEASGPGVVPGTEAIEHLREHRFLPVRTRAVRPSIQLVLLDAERLAYLQHLTPIARLDHAVLVVGVVLPVRQHLRQVTVHRFVATQDSNDNDMPRPRRNPAGTRRTPP